VLSLHQKQLIHIVTADCANVGQVVVTYLCVQHLWGKKKERTYIYIYKGFPN